MWSSSASRQRLAVERVQRALDRGGDAGERRRVALGVCGGLGRAQALHEVEERAPGRRPRTRRRTPGRRARTSSVVLRSICGYSRPTAMCSCMIRQRSSAGSRVPLARLDERVDEQVLGVGGADLQARLVGVLRRLGHRQVGVRRLAPLHQAALREHDVELVDALEVRRLGEQHQVGVPARADERERAQQALGREVLAGGEELALVGARARSSSQPAPGRIDLQERVLDEVTLGHCRSTVSEGPRRWGCPHREPRSGL